MEQLGQLMRGFNTTVVERAMAYLPSLLGAFLLVILGWFVARILRAVTLRLVLLGEALFSRISPATDTDHARIRRASTVLGSVVFWGVLLVFVMAATQVLELDAFANGLSRLVGYLPTLLAGLLILAGGYVLARVLANLVMATTTRLEQTQRVTLARLAQVVVITASMLVGADQIGIRITFLAIFALAIAGVVGGGVAIATGLGARDYVRNLIGAHQLRQAFAVGQLVRAAGHEGKILDMTATTVVLETREGRVVLPGRIYGEVPIIVLAGAVDG